MESEINNCNDDDSSFYLGFGNLNALNSKEMSTLSHLNQQTDIVYNIFIKHLGENDVKNI